MSCEKTGSHQPGNRHYAHRPHQCRRQLLRAVPHTGALQHHRRKTGFKRFVANDIEVRVADQVKVEITLTLGNVAESIEVTPQTLLLATAEANLGQVVDERRAVELPLFAGNAMDLVHLAPGAVKEACANRLVRLLWPGLFPPFGRIP